MQVPAKDQEPERSQLSQYLKYSTVGIQFFVAVALSTGGGIWLDRRLGTGVLFTLLGLALGFAGGFYALYKDLFAPRSRPGRGEKGPSPGRERERKEGQA